MLLGLLPPKLDEGLKLLRMLLGQIVRLREILLKIEELPFVVFVTRADRMMGDRLPTLVPKATVPEHLEILGSRLGGCFRILEAGRKASSLRSASA